MTAAIGLEGHAARLARMLLAASALALGVGAASASAASAPMKVVLKFDGSGTFSASNGVGTDTPDHADVSLKWSTVYTGTVGADGSITLQAGGASATGEGGLTTASPPGTFHYTLSGLFSADCTGQLPLAPGAPRPVASASGGTLNVQSITSVDQNNATGQVNCPGTGPLGDSFDATAQAANLAGAFAPSLPDVLAARISLPPDALKSGSFTRDVSDADAPAQLPASCADQFGESDGQCQMSLHWSGTIQILVPCGQVTSSEGNALPVGAIVSNGQTLTTGAKSRLVITLPDGAVYEIGPNSQVVCNGESIGTGHPASVTDSFRLILGKIWGATLDLTGGHSFSDGDCPPGAACTTNVGTRGSAFTESIMPGGKRLLHVIDGTGFVRIEGKPEFDFPAGEGVTLSGSAYTETTSWPAADQALVPAAQQPPKITAVRLAGTHAGGGPTIHFRLDRNAVVTIQIQHGRRRALNKRVAERQGPRSIRLGRLARGDYTLTLFASAQGRSVAVQKTFHIS